MGCGQYLQHSDKVRRGNKTGDLILIRLLSLWFFYYCFLGLCVNFRFLCAMVWNLYTMLLTTIHCFSSNFLLLCIFFFLFFFFATSVIHILSVFNMLRVLCLFLSNIILDILVWFEYFYCNNSEVYPIQQWLVAGLWFFSFGVLHQ